MRLTKKKAFDISIELWQWLAEDGSRRKSQWPGWGKYGKNSWECALCLYYDTRGSCKACPISSCITDFAFGDWEKALTVPDRKKYAGLFLEQLKEKREAIK